MHTKIPIIVAALYLLVLPSDFANAGLFDWIAEQDTVWTFESLYNSVAQKTDEPENPSTQEVAIVETKIPVTPVETRLNQVKHYVVTATAYSSTVDQTDDTPFITASGTYVRDGIAAANFLPFGTMFKIPDLYGDKIFIVEDRMHKRYWHRIDIWFPERQMAKEFGVKQIRIEIVS